MSIILNASKMEPTGKTPAFREELAELRLRALGMYEHKKFSKAVETLTEFHDRSKTELGVKHLWYVEASVSLVNTYYALKKFSSALEVASSFRQTYQFQDGPEARVISKWLNNLAEVLFHHQQFLLARDICWLALDICQRFPQEHFDELTRTRNNLASVFIFLGQLHQAEELFRSNLTAMQKKYGTKHTLVATLMNNLGELCRQQYRFKDAEIFLDEALRIRRELLDKGNPLIDQSLNNIGFLRMNQGRYLSAQKAFEEAISNDPSGSKIIHTAQQLSSQIGLAETKIHSGYLKQAEELLEEALAIAEKLLPSDHLRIGHILTLLATTYHRLWKGNLAQQTIEQARNHFIEQKASHKAIYAPVLLLDAEMIYEEKKFEQAEILLQQALKLQVQSLGNEHLEVSKTLQQLALVFGKLGRDSRSKSILKNVMEIKAKLLGNVHPEIVITQIMYARCNNMRKAYKQAEQNCQLAEQTMNALKEELPVLNVMLSHQLALALRGQNRIPEALQMFQKELAISEQLYGADAYNLTKVLEYIASLQLELKQLENSAVTLRRSMSLIEKRHNAYHLDYAEESLKLAFVEYELKNYSCVTELFEKALAIKKARLGKDHSSVIELTRDTIKLFNKIGETEKATALQKELDFEEGKDQHVLFDLF